MDDIGCGASARLDEPSFIILVTTDSFIVSHFAETIMPRAPTCVLLMACLIQCGGCGPLTMPMPARLDAESQSRVEESWNNAFTPTNRLSSQALLDTLMVSQGFQVGVDRLFMRSEKRCNAGLVVMEIAFDRLNPATSTFTVTLLSPTGKVLRTHSYTGDNVEATYRELFIERNELEEKATQAQLSVEDSRRLNALRARHELAVSVFPDDHV